MIIAWHIRSPNSVKRAEVIAFVVTGWLLSRTKYLYMPRKDIILFYIYMHIYVCMCLSYLIRPLKQEKTDMCVCNMISASLCKHLFHHCAKYHLWKERAWCKKHPTIIQNLLTVILQQLVVPEQLPRNYLVFLRSSFVTIYRVF